MALDALGDTDTEPAVLRAVAALEALEPLQFETYEDLVAAERRFVFHSFGVPRLFTLASSKKNVFRHARVPT